MPFKPGQSGNLKGRPTGIINIPQLPPELREERKNNQAGLIRLITLYCNLTDEQAKQRLAGPETLQLEQMVQGVIDKAKEGNIGNFQFLMDLMVGKIPDIDFDDFSEDDFRLLKRIKQMRETHEKKMIKHG